MNEHTIADALDAGLVALGVGIAVAGFFLGQGLTNLGRGIGSILSDWDNARSVPLRDALVALAAAVARNVGGAK